MELLTFKDEIMGIINFPRMVGRFAGISTKESKEFYPNHCPSAIAGTMMFPMENLHLEVIFMDFPMVLVVSGRYSHIFLSSDVLHCFAMFCSCFSHWSVRIIN